MITVRKVEPIGSHAATGFLEYADRGKSGIGTVTLHDYPPSPRGKALREARHAADLGDAGDPPCPRWPPARDGGAP